MQMIKRQYHWLKDHFIQMKLAWKEAGIKGLYRKYGLKLFLAFFVYYLVRDLIIYIYLPWYFATKFITN